MSYKFCYCILLRTADALLYTKIPRWVLILLIPFAVEGQIFTVDIYSCVCSATPVILFVESLFYVMISYLSNKCLLCMHGT